MFNVTYGFGKKLEKLEGAPPAKKILIKMHWRLRIYNPGHNVLAIFNNLAYV